MKTSQKNRLRALFKSRPNQDIPLPEILRMGLAQYNTRVLELRREGMNIENRIQPRDGVRHSFFRYVPGSSEYKRQESFDFNLTK